MAWPTFTVDVTQNSNQIKVYGAVPASELPAGFEVIISGISNLEVSYGTAVMYDGSNNPYSHLYLVRPYTGTTAVSLEMVVKPTGSQFNDVVSIFQNGSNLLNSTMEGYRQFVEGTNPVTFQPLDENAAPISIKPLQLMNQEAQASINQFGQDAQAVLESQAQSVNEMLANKTVDGDDTTPGALLHVGATIQQMDRTNSNIEFKPDVSPTMDFNFAANTYRIYDSLTNSFKDVALSEVLTHTRESDATGVDPIGRVGTVGSNVPRMVFEEGTAKGYLSEEQRTNILTWSDDLLNLKWEHPRATIFNLGNGVFKLSASPELNNSNLYQLMSATGSLTTYTLSVLAKADDNNYLGMSSGGVPTSIGSGADKVVIFNLLDGVISVTNSAYNPKIKKVSDGWYLCSITFYTNGTGSFSPYITDSGETSFNRQGDNSTGVLVSFPQLEVGSFPTSCIKTEASTVTRTADSMTRTLGNEWNPNEGTFVVEFELMRPEPSSSYFPLLSQGGDTNTLWLFVSSVDGCFRVASNSGTQAVSSGVEADKYVKYKACITSTKNNMQISMNGSSTVSGVSNGSLLTMASMTFGSNLTIKRLTYYPKAFDAATSQKLSRTS